MNLYCPDCKALVDPDNINIKTNLAKCQDCGLIENASELFRSSKSLDINPPKGSKIIKNYQSTNEVEFMYPKSGFTFPHALQILFLTIWLSGISAWTFATIQASILFAMFSIPFWLVGIAILISVVNSINEVQLITVSSSKLILTKTKPLLSKTYERNLEDIHFIKMKTLKADSIFKLFESSKGMSFIPGVKVPAILTIDKTQYFFEGASDGDQEWIVQTLTLLLEAKKR